MPTTSLKDATDFFRWLGQTHPAVYTLEDNGIPLYRSDGSVKLSQILEECKNTYFSLAIPLKGLKKKAQKTELVSTQFLHVDLDPIDGQDPIKEQDRLLDSVTDSRPKDVPPPSCIIASGRGIQALWKLKEAVELPQGLENIELANLWLMQRLNAPPGTHNVDRILRVPGSWNALDPKKIARGYQPRMAELIETNTNVYTLEDFGKWEAPTVSTSTSHGGSADDVNDEIIRIDDLEYLNRYKIPLRVTWLISYGTPSADLETYERDFGGVGTRNAADRSAWVYDVVCQLLRFGVPRGEILGLLTDPAWRISGHCLDQKDPERAARRQLARGIKTVELDAKSDELNVIGGSLGDKPAAQPAKPEPPADDTDDSDTQIDQQYKIVLEINSNHFAVLTGNRVVYYREDGARLIGMNKEAMEFNLGDKFVTSVDSKGNVIYTPAFKAWARHPERRYYKDGFILKPGVESDTAYNLWRGFAVEQKQGDWSLIDRHVYDVLANGNEELYNYILDWTAWAFQNPASPPGTALIFIGFEGTGKGLFCNALVDIFGRQVHGLRIQNTKHLVGTFNAHLRNCCMLFCDEATTPDIDGRGALKGLVTEPTIPIEGKGIDVVNADNHLHVCMASNEDFVVPAGKQARRWVVCNVSERERDNTEYFDKLRDQLANGGLEAMLYDLLRRDISKFNPISCAPTTEGLNQQKAYTLQGFERVWLDCLMTGEVPFTRFCDRQGTMPFVATGAMQAFAASRLKTEVSSTSVGTVLRELGYKKDLSARPRGFMVPALPEARRLWDEKRFKLRWDDTDCWSALDWAPEKTKRMQEPESGDQLF